MTWLYRQADVHECIKPGIDPETMTPGDIWRCDHQNKNTLLYCNRVHLITSSAHEDGLYWQEITQERASALIADRLNRVQQ